MLPAISGRTASTLGKLFEGAQHGVVEERAALHDNMRAHVVRVANL